MKKILLSLLIAMIFIQSSFADTAKGTYTTSQRKATKTRLLADTVGHGWRTDIRVINYTPATIYISSPVMAAIAPGFEQQIASNVYDGAPITVKSCMGDYRSCPLFEGYALNFDDLEVVADHMPGKFSTIVTH